MTGLAESLELVVDRFLEHKRAHGRKYHSEHAELRLLVAFAAEHGVTRLEERRQPCWMTSSRRGLARGRGASTICSASSVACWTGRSASSCWKSRHFAPDDGGSPPAGSRSCSTPSRHASCWGRPLRLRTIRGRRSEDRPTGRCSHCATGSGCAPVRRADCSCATSTRPAISSSSAAGSSARAGWSRTDRGSPRCSASSSNAAAARGRSAARSRCSASTAHALCIPAPPARPSTSSCSPSLCRCLTGSRHHGCTASVTASRSGACCAGIARGLTRRPGCISSRRSWGTSTRPRPPST